MSTEPPKVEPPPKVVGLHSRKAFEAKPASTELVVKVDENSVKFLNEMVKLVKEGHLRNVGIVGVYQNTAMTALQHNGASIHDFAVINLAVDTLKNLVRDYVDEYAQRASVTAEGLTEAEDDDE